MKSQQEYICDQCEETFSKHFDCIEHSNLHSGFTPFMCPVCDTKFSIINEYVQHAKAHTIYKCQDCSDSFFFEEDLLRHTCNLNAHPEETLPSIETETKSHPAQIAKTYTCVICSQSFENYSDLKNHREIHFKTRKKCNYCLKAFANNNLLKSHLESHRKKSNYSCIYCKVSFKSLKHYANHKKEAHNFKCENCNRWFMTGDKLLKHVCFISSNGEAFKCSCFKIFTKASAFKIHIGDRPYACCNCSMQFNTITNLVRHIRTHTKQKPYVCNYCDRRFTQSANLRNHVSVHLGNKAVKCNECNFSCKTQSGLFKHKKKHKEGFMNKTYVDGRKTSTSTTSCPICKKQFLFKRNVGMHMKVHKKKESLCTECGKVFNSKSKLTTHYKACHGQPSICKVCGKTFASFVLLTAHEKIHVSDKQFSCSICFKMFSIKNYLVQHMKTHNEGKQYSCNKCGKLFKVAVSLKYHNKICASLNISVV